MQENTWARLRDLQPWQMRDSRNLSHIFPACLQGVGGSRERGNEQEGNEGVLLHAEHSIGDSIEGDEVGETNLI